MPIRPASPVRLTACLLVLVTAALIVGCDTVKAPGAATPDPAGGAAYPQVTALEGLGDYVSMDKPVVRRREGQPLSVVVPVRLRSDREVAAQYRYIFFDDTGRPVDPDMDWRYVVLPPRSQVFLEGASLDPAAVDWRLEIRPAR